MSDHSGLEQSDRAVSSLSILEAIAERDGSAASTMEPPLYEIVDPDALDQLLGGNGRDTQPPVTVRFEYAGHRIVAGSDGTLEIE